MGGVHGVSPPFLSGWIGDIVLFSTVRQVIFDVNGWSFSCGPRVWRYGTKLNTQVKLRKSGVLPPNFSRVAIRVLSYSNYSD